MFEKAMINCRIWFKIAWAAVTSSSNQVFYDRIASMYDHAFVTHKIHARTISKELAKCFETRVISTLVLDLGCGTGMLSVLLAENGFMIYGLDVSFQSLGMLKEKKEHIPVVQADAENIPLADNSLDAVVCLGVWRHFPDPWKVMSEIRRVLADDGVMILGYFPPAIGGTLQFSQGPVSQFVLFLYHKMVRTLGYIDRADLLMEEETFKAAEKQFVQVDKIRSGEHWNLIFAKSPVKQV